MPAEYAPWPTIYGLFRRWQRDGTWEKILAALQAQGDARGRIGWTVSVDSMTSRAHQHAAGAHHAPPADIPAEVVATTELDTGGRVE